MIYSFSPTAMLVFAIFVGSVLGLSFYLGRRARSAQGYFAAHGQIPWFINGVAFAGDYLSAASFLGICGMIAFYGYDGFLYSIGYLAGWIVALFVIAEPIKRLGKFTFADALDSKFNSRGIKLMAAISTLVVSIFYLIPQMVGAGALIKPLLGLSPLHLGPVTIAPFTSGVVIVGLIVIFIVVTAGMVSTTWVQFIKGALLVFFCAILTVMILYRGLTTHPNPDGDFHAPRVFNAPADELLNNPSEYTVLPEEGGWIGKPYVRTKDKQGIVRAWRRTGSVAGFKTIQTNFVETQTLTIQRDGHRWANGQPQGHGANETDFFSTGNVDRLPDNPATPGQRTGNSGPLGPLSYLTTLQGSQIVLWSSDDGIKEADGSRTTVYYPETKPGTDVLVPGNHPMFSGLRSDRWQDRLNFLSLMLALFCGTAALPHILIRYYTVKDQAAARKSTIVGIASIGLFYILTLYLGLGAMTSGMMDVTSSNMAVPLLAKSFGELPFAIISAIAFTTVLGTVSGLIMAASGAVAHDLMHNLFKRDFDDQGKVFAGKIAAVTVGVIAIGLGILFEKMNVTFLVGWAFNIAASANLPAIIMLLFWKGTSKRGVAISILVGMLSSLAWILLSGDAYANLYGLKAAAAPMPFNQPGIVTIPLSFLVLIVVSLIAPPKAAAEVVATAGARG